jgi:hypothetical protein
MAIRSGGLNRFGRAGHRAAQMKASRVWLNASPVSGVGGAGDVGPLGPQPGRQGVADAFEGPNWPLIREFRFRQFSSLGVNRYGRVSNGVTPSEPPPHDP